MTETATSLIPATLTLLFGMVTGLIAAMRTTAGEQQANRQPAKNTSDTGAPVLASALDLEEEIEQAVLQLRDLELYRERMSDDSYRDLRQSLESRASDRLAEHDQRFGNDQNGTTDQAIEDRAKKRPLTAAAVVVIGGLGAFGLAQRTAESPVGTAHQGDAQQATEADALGGEFQVLMKRLQDNPTDVAAMVRVAHLLLRTQHLDEANALTERALELEPDNVEAKVHEAVLLGATGDNEAALSSLDLVLGDTPNNAEAWFFRGMLSMNIQDYDKMRESFTQYVEQAKDGPRKERIKQMLTTPMGQTQE